MKIKRYFSQDLRSAVQAVRNELGLNAVIISHHQVGNGIEVTAAVDEESLQASDSQPIYLRNINSQAPLNTHDELRQQTVPVKNVHYYNNDNNKQSHAIDNISRTTASGNDSCTINVNTHGFNAHGFTEHDSMNKVVLSENQNEKNSGHAQPKLGKKYDCEKLNSLIEQQVIEHAWGDIARKNPVRAQLIRKLLKLDIHPVIIQKVTGAISGDNIALQSVFPHALALIANQLPIYKEDVTACGGTVALFGSPGVGKTTTIAKMAARFALRNGRDKVGLVTADSNRLGAKEQLGIYSKILGIPLKVVHDDIELLDALNSFSDKSFVLIDTAGMGPKEVSSSKYFELFSGAITQIKNFFVMPATNHRAALEKSVAAFQGIQLDGSIITKLDEAASLGGLLSVTIMNNLPIAYYSDGQKIPDDFHLARAHNLVSHAVSVADDFSDTQPVEADYQDKAGIEANVCI